MKTQISQLGRQRRARLSMAIVLGLVLALAVTAVALALQADNVDGVWGSPTPSNTSSFRWCYGPDNLTGPAGAPTDCDNSSASIQNPPDSTVEDENQFRYGTPASGSGSANRSGYGFNGNNTVGSITALQPFFLGRFTHYNRPINADNPLTGIDLTVTIDGLLCNSNLPPDEGGTQTFVYHFTHDETPNDANPCPYGNSTGNGCDDKVTVDQVPDTIFHCGDAVPLTVQILGFYTNANCHVSPSGSTSGSFITGEGQDNPACLWARIAEPDTSLAVSLASFQAEWIDNEVAVTWDTVSEINNLGFNLYRSETPDQVGELITPQMIPSQAPGGLQGFSYSFVDSDVTPGQTYWYTLGDLEMSGLETLHGPVSAAPQAPTAVTLADLAADATPATSNAPALVMLALALAATVALAVVWRRQARAR